MRRTSALIATLAAPLVLVVLTACSGNGSISLPTSRPSLSLPSVSRTSALPDVTAPTLTLPTQPTQPGPSSPAETVTRTATETTTQTATQTATQTRTVTQTETATETATVTQTAAPEAPTPAPSATPPPGAAASAPADDAGAPWWPWLLLALVVVAALVWWLVRRQETQTVAREWDERLADAELEASWIEDSLTAQVLSQSSTVLAQQIWTAAQPRLLAADATFHTLATTAPDGARATRATDVGGLLRGLAEAVGADLASPPGAGRDQFRARRAVVDAARRDLRAALGPVRTPSDGGEPTG